MPINPSETYKECVSQLKDFVLGAGATDVVLGLSGGIDSSLVAVMAVDAFGADHVHGLLLPGPYSSLSSIEDASKLAANLGIATNTMSIDAPYQAFMSEIEDATGEVLTGVAPENIQARCRMVFIMAMANANGWLMLNTGNKSEAAMGYSTLYGDTAGAYAPIGGLYKTEVYALARWCNERAHTEGSKPPIPPNVLVKPPSAELAPGQMDEASMGIDYCTLDNILIAIYEDGKSAADLIAEGLDGAQIESVIQRYKANAFKRALEPEFPCITRK